MLDSSSGKFTQLGLCIVPPSKLIPTTPPMLSAAWESVLTARGDTYGVTGTYAEALVGVLLLSPLYEATKLYVSPLLKLLPIGTAMEAVPLLRLLEPNVVPLTDQIIVPVAMEDITPITVAVHVREEPNAIGSGEHVSTEEAIGVLTGELSGTPADGLAYALWSDPTFARTYQPSTSHSRYLTIDGVDPLEDHYGVIGSMPAGTIPTRSNGLLANVTLSHVQDGSYPIWSLLRLVDIGGAPGLSALAAEAQNFVSFNSSTARPDFVPLSSFTFPTMNLGVLRSHFTPPGQIVSPSNGANVNFLAEAGGDVGGVVYTMLGDADFCVDFQSPGTCTGQTGDRR